MVLGKLEGINHPKIYLLICPVMLKQSFIMVQDLMSYHKMQMSLRVIA